MLRMKPVGSPKRAESYYAKTDGGYYQAGNGLRCWWGGKGADLLGLTGLTPVDDYFKNLVYGRDPRTGEQLTARLVDNRIPAWDVTACVPKRVTELAEGGDERVPPAIRRALERAMKKVEQYATTRVRVDGKQEDRVTSNLIWYAVEHPDTRPVEDETLPEGHKWKIMPDPDRHIHVVIFNLTWDNDEQKWKAVKFRPIMDLRKYFDRCFDAELAAELADLGYPIKTEWKENRKGKMSFYSWDIEGIPGSMVAKDSRRSKEIDRTEAELLATLKEQYGDYAPERLSAVERAKLGATSRRVKRDDLTLGECREYWDSRYTPEEKDGRAEAIRRARLGLNPRPENRLAAAVSFSMRHHFEKESALPIEELVTTALEHAMGSARPDDVERELTRQGVIIVEKNGKRLATTQALQDEEWGLAAYALDGRGMVAPIGVEGGLARKLLSGETLSAGQWDAVLGLLRSANRVELITGPAGAGKSKLLKKFDEGAKLAGESVTYLGTTSTAVKVLKKDGFADAQTLAAFLLSDKMQAAARGGRVVVDETSILGHADAVRLFAAAKKNDLKLIFVGDPMQHGSIGRGNFMRLITEHGRIKPFRLTEILRQSDPEYRAAAQLLSEGKPLEGFQALDKLGWVKEMADGEDRHRHMAADYVQAVLDGVAWNDVLVVAPTHREAGFITGEIRRQLRDAGKLGTEERQFTRLVAAEASEAERGLASTYRAGDVIQFYQNAKGGFVKGQRLVVTDPAKVPLSEAGRFSVYRPEQIALAAGDVIRFTGTVHTLGKDHTVKNGDTHAVAGFTDAGGIRLDNGWVISGKDAGHFRSGFVETSIGSQGRTVKQVILSMSAAMGRAVNMQQLYVSASRAWDKLRVYVDEKDEVRDAIQRDSRKLLALDLKSTPEAVEREKRQKQENQRLADIQERQRRSAYERFAAAWNGPPVNPDHTPPPSYRGREQERQQERDHTHGR
jgi:conjugative relaxase-like TrwC/TraI family protein